MTEISDFRRLIHQPLEERYDQRGRLIGRLGLLVGKASEILESMHAGEISPDEAVALWEKHRAAFRAESGVTP